MHLNKVNVIANLNDESKGYDWRDNSNLTPLIMANNSWQKCIVGKYKSGSNVKVIDCVDMYIRKRNIEDFLKMSSIGNEEKVKKNVMNTGFLSMGSNTTIANPEDDMTPSLSCDKSCSNIFVSNIIKHTTLLPGLSKFSLYPSLQCIRKDNTCITIAFDSEWDNGDGNNREMLSYQFALMWDEELIEICFLDKGKGLSLEMAIGAILDQIGISSVDERSIVRYEYCYDWIDGKPITKVTSSQEEARRNAVYIYKNGRFIIDKIEYNSERFLPCNKRDWSFFHRFLDLKSVPSIPITLVCHAGKFDISALKSERYDSILKFLTEVQGGLVTMIPIRLDVRSLASPNNKRIYPISLTIADTMCHAPAGKKKLKDLGETIGVQKIDIPNEQKKIIWRNYYIEIHSYLWNMHLWIVL